MSEISSGLVACLWMRTDEDGDIETNTINCFSCGNTDGYPLVRLSDAEAIIAQKDAEILEQCRINGMGAERESALLGKVAQQSAALKLAREALAYHQSQTRPIHQTNEALAAINEVLKGE